MLASGMNAYDRPVTAVLGPTNTGKTHLAIERMCGHSSGMIGFPLRLLAREVYDRVVKLKGKDRVALITGEERIVPSNARWFLCTAESMPADKDVSFLALDEAQLGAAPVRGLVFTDRLLRARGRTETMILGSETLRPRIRALVPEAEIVERPRFSTLSYAGVKKLSRLPKRSAIVAFSAEEVYAVAEMIRRLRGGAAVVMGALSPRTRNAQVAMFQAGEVDYLVATDAIGMGLNMDVSHVAFASLSKFDGQRQRRLSVSEMAQIAGRAGRHQRDGTFGALVDEGIGDVETIAGRIAGVRTWAYIAHRSDWLADPAHWAARTGEVEERLSDALHASLTQRFVDKRTTVLLRQIREDAGALPVVIGEEGEVLVEDHPIGTLSGFTFSVAADARAADKRLLLAAAEKRLGAELARRAGELAAADDDEITVRPEPVEGRANGTRASTTPDPVRGRTEIVWRDFPVASITPGPNLALPRVPLDRAVAALAPAVPQPVPARLDVWLASRLARHLPVFGKLDAVLRDAAACGPLRAVAGALLEAGGLLPRRAVGVQVEALDAAARKRLGRIGVTIGTLDLFAPAQHKPAAAHWRRVRMPRGAPPREGVTVLPRGAPGADLAHGFRPLGQQAVRVDLVARIARAAHAARTGRAPFATAPALAPSIGLQPDTLARLMAQLGFRTARPDAEGRPQWMWQGLTPNAKPTAPPKDNAFAALAGMLDG